VLRFTSANPDGSRAAAGEAQTLRAARDLAQDGRIDDARRIAEAMLQRSPDDADALEFLGRLELRAANAEAAARSFSRLVESHPARPPGHIGLALVEQARGNHDGAIAHFRQALALDPRRYDLLVRLGRSLLSRGSPAEAEPCFRAACDLNPGHESGWLGLGNALLQQRKTKAARAAFERAVQVAPGSLNARLNLSKALRRGGEAAEAIRILEEGLGAATASPDALTHLGLAHEQLGAMDRAVACYRQALALAPADAKIHSMLLYALTMHPGVSREETFRQHLEFGRVFGGKAGDVTHANNRDRDRQLRIGYVSADFWQHAVACFIEPVLRHHDRSGFAVFCYANVGEGDATTARLKQLDLHWRSILGLSDHDFLRLIRDDAIDILIDLSGHTGGNRLPVFAHRPAPVQATWIGYPNTTGLKEIDYRLVNGFTPPSQDASYTERLFRLPTTAACYDRHAGAPAPAPPPAAHTGFVTFGSFNSVKKLNDDVIRVWSAVLRAVAGSKLLIKSSGTREPEVRARLGDLFSRNGIDAGCVDFEGASPAPHHLERYAAVDIMLDSFPYTGGTTTRDALWMGVPVVTLFGEALSHRMSAELLRGVGLREWIAYSPDEYVSLAASLASDLDRLVSLRAGQRDMLRQTASFNPKIFMPQLEQALRTMWAQWCDRQS
jgi:predicted O-linked N-acetylglucosamine transferase (SPINDLY family)